MKIVVAYQWAPDPKEATVNADGTIDYSRAKAVISDFDAVAIEVGRQLADANGAGLIGVCVGGPDVAASVATKAALSRGLDEVVVVSDPALAKAGTLAIAQVIAAVVKSTEDVGLVITGDSSIDTGARMTGSIVAGLLGWPVVTDARTLTAAGAAWSVERTLNEGVQTLSVAGPAVISVAADAAKLKAPGMKDILAAGKKPVTTKALADLGIGLPDEGTVRSTAKLTGPQRKQVVIATSDPAQAAAELVAALRAADVLN